MCVSNKIILAVIFGLKQKKKLEKNAIKLRHKKNFD